MRRTTATCLVILLLAAACGEEFDPRSYLQEPRVIAMITEPPELVAGQTVALEAVTYVPPERTVVSESWTFCPFSLGSQGGFACVFEDCEVPLAAAGASVEANPVALSLPCLTAHAAELEGLVPDPGTSPADAEPIAIEALFRYRLETDDGFVREAVQRVPVWTAPPDQPLNQRPALGRIRIVGGPELEEGKAAPPVAEGDEIDIDVFTVPASLESYVDGTGADRQEEALVSFFTTAGRFEYDRDVGELTSNTWKAKKLEDGQTEAWFYIVLRDNRGGQDARGPFLIPITR